VRPHLSELLDQPGAPAADVAVSLADLRRYNRWLGGASVLLRLLAAEGLDRFSLLDVGAASGDLAQAVRQRFPGARVVLCDKHPAHLPGQGVAAEAEALPFAGRSFDLGVPTLRRRATGGKSMTYAL
jgi:hypothetical protein